jgi:predicted transcriptional regulator
MRDIMSNLTAMKEKLDRSKVMNYVFMKHNVLPNYQSEDVSNAIDNLFGLHAARLPTPFTTLFSRVSSFETQTLWDHLYVINDHIKLRCMRRTLHILPLKYAPIAHRATMHFRLADCYTLYKKLGVDMDYVSKIKSIILSFVQSKPMTSKEIVSLVKFELGKLSDEDNKVITTAIKELWEAGELCYINKSTHWGKEDRYYGYTPSIYPNLNLNQMDIKEAQKKLVYFHIDRFGPVSIKDIAWWSGLSVKIIQDSIKELIDKVIMVELDATNIEYFMTERGLSYYQDSSFQNEAWLTLLAYEDPSLKGYYESRFLYVEQKHYELLFNKIGESRASIILDGKAIGIWTIDKSKRNIDWMTFEKVDTVVKKRIKSKIEHMHSFLFG